MDDILATIRAFVSGELSPTGFRDALYSDDRFETFLENDPKLLPGNYVGRSVYQFLLMENYDSPGSVLNAQGALTDFMDRNGISYSRTSKYTDTYDLILEAQPRWLALDDKYVQDEILPNAGSRSCDELREWLADELLKRFQYVSKPPKWIQSPSWPIGRNGPLVFLGQLNVNDYFHDAATIYVFHDQTTGEFQTVCQVY
jgi:hypothetical protein